MSLAGVAYLFARFPHETKQPPTYFSQDVQASRSKPSLSSWKWPKETQDKSASIRMEKDFFVGSYTKAFLELTNVTMEELTFRIPAGAKAGIVSPSRDADYDPQRPDVMICIGFEPGGYGFEVVNSSTNIVLASYRFTVSTHWNDPAHGPGLSFVGVMNELATETNEFAIQVTEDLPSDPAWGR
jgi:hypothetical protein